MIDTVIVRSAKEEDFVPLCALYHESVQRNQAGFIQDLAFHGCMIAKTRQWREAGGDMLVALDGDTLIGMGALAPHGHGKVELCKLHVNEAMQGRGIGRMLAERLIARAVELGFAEIELHVTRTQVAAVGLYRQLGFERLKEERFTTVVFGQPASFDTVFMRMALGTQSRASAA
ncbi:MULTISPECIES: GNAT family N-acetyltransferase [Rhodomicrobium]|uniref:GNAT family N-acetyltransferase n=1 Tax=Rhodomicrobium TaxID=1068 RepID=UPI000B4A9936|nr:MULTISPECIES: GNAT family N-acetyltransferase [Rhodomicrobium]